MMNRMLRRVRALRDDQSGLTMAEILVASMMTMGILIMVTTMFVQTTKITMASNQTKQSNTIAANIANEISAVLRVTSTLAVSNSAIPETALSAATRSSVTVYAFSNTSAANPAPVKVTFAIEYVSARNIYVVKETRCVGVASGGYWTFSSCASTSTRTIGEGIIPATGTSNQLFTYRDANDAPIIIGTGAMVAADRAKVASIVVQVNVTAPGSKNDPVFISNTVVLRNLGLDSGS